MTNLIASIPYMSELCSVAVIRSKVITGLCFVASSGKWSEERVLIHKTSQDECERHEVGYMLTSIRLRQTLCGEIMKGCIVKRFDGNEMSYPSIDCLPAVARENIDSLWKTTNDNVAIKIDRRKQMKRLHNKNSTLINPENPWKEVAALQLLGNEHQNVIHLLGAFFDDECLYEALPYWAGGSLSTYMRSHPSGVSESEARHIFAQVLLGLHYIHSHGVCHHDISTDNIMLDEHASCTIIDFGMSLRVPHSYLDDPYGTTDDVTDESMGTMRRLIHSHNHCGKLRFMAPEVYQKKYAFDGLAADVWSSGIVLFVLITGRQPYERPDTNDSGYHDLVQLFYWDIDKVNPLFSWGRDVSREIVSLLKCMLNPEPSHRATLSQIMNHEWLNSCE